MEKTEVVKNFILSIENGDAEKANSYLSDDFNFALPIPFPLGKFQVLTFFRMIKNSLPDLSYNHNDLREEGGKVKVTLKPSGTHTVDFVIPGMASIPASNKKWDLPPTGAEFVVIDDKIKEMSIPNLPLEMLGGMAKNMGFNLPGMS